MLSCFSTTAHIQNDIEYASIPKYWVTPKYVEEEFVRKKGALVPLNYIRKLEKQLKKICKKLKTTDEKVSNYGDVLYCKVKSFPLLARIILYRTYVRPCINGFGIMRLFLYCLAETAYACGCDLHIDEPQSEMEKLLFKSFGRKDLTKIIDEQAKSEPNPNECKRYVIFWNDCAYAYEKLGLDRINILSLDSTVHAILGSWPKSFKPHLNAKAFPTAEELNFGFISQNENPSFASFRTTPREPTHLRIQSERRSGAVRKTKKK